MRKLAIIFLSCIAVGTAAFSEQPAPSGSDTATQPQSEARQTNADSKSSEKQPSPAPIQIEILKAPIIQAETTDKTEKRSDYASPEWWLVYLTLGLVLVTAALAIFTGYLYNATVQLGRDAKESGAGQANQMKNAILEAARSAKAMEDVASHLKINADKIIESVEISKSIGENQKVFSEMQTRAYVSLEIGAAQPQNSATGFRFEARPMLINNGMTSAKNFTYVLKAAILPVPLGENSAPVLEIPANNPKSIIPPRQTRFMHAVVDALVPDEEVEPIRHGIGQALYVWGTFAYDDVFGRHWRNEFCHQLSFLENRDGNGFTVNGLFVGNRNKET